MSLDTARGLVLASGLLALAAATAAAEGPDPVVTIESCEPSRGDLRSRVEQAAATAAARRVEPPDRLEVLSVRFGGADPVAAAEPELELLEAEGPNASGVVRLRFRLLAGGTPRGEARATVRGVVRGPVLVARRALGGGRPIAAGDVELADTDRTRLPGTPLRAPQELAGFVPVRTIGTGRPITTDLLRPAPVVRKGDVVRLEVRGEGLIVTAQGMAARDGAPGDTVPAVNVASGARLRGEVQKDGSLLVRGGRR